MHQIRKLKWLSSRLAIAFSQSIETRSSADRWCSNYIWVIKNFIANSGASYIRDLTVVIFKLISRMDMLSIFWEISLQQISQELTDDSLTMVQGMGWCYQAA